MSSTQIPPLAFINGLIEAEFKALCAPYDEPDDDAFKAIVDASLVGWYAPEIVDSGYKQVRYQRPYTPEPVDEALFPGWDPGPMPDHEADRAKLRPSSVLRWMRYQHPTHGELWRFDLDPDKPLIPQRIFRRALFVWPEAGARLVRSIYARCRACETLGVVDYEPCEKCGGRGWVHRYGEELGELGEQLELHKLLRPDYPHHARVFDAS